MVNLVGIRNKAIHERKRTRRRKQGLIDEYDVTFLLRIVIDGVISPTETGDDLIHFLVLTLSRSSATMHVTGSSGEVPRYA